MSQALAAIAPPPVSPFRSDREFVLRLRSSRNWRIEPEWSKHASGRPDLRSLRIHGWLGRSEAHAALEEIDTLNAPAEVSEVMDAFNTLTAVTMRPADLDDTKVISYAQHMPKVLLEYPRDVALETLREWPKTHGGGWWPIEHDIRAELDARMQFRRKLRDRLDDAAEQGEADVVRSPMPVGMTAVFAERVRERRGADYVYSWLSWDSGCEFSENTVFTVRFGVDTLLKDVGDIADVLRVAIVHCPDVTAAFHKRIDAKAAFR